VRHTLTLPPRPRRDRGRIESKSQISSGEDRSFDTGLHHRPGERHVNSFNASCRSISYSHLNQFEPQKGTGQKETAGAHK
jgi:hypothetical protein